MKEITVRYVQETYLSRITHQLETIIENAERRIIWFYTKVGLLIGAAVGILICFFADFDGFFVIFLKWAGVVLLSSIVCGIAGFVYGRIRAYKYCLVKFGQISNDVALYKMAGDYISANDFSTYNKALEEVWSNKTKVLNPKTIAMDFTGRIYFGLQDDINKAVRIIIALGILAGVVVGGGIGYAINDAMLFVLAVGGGIAGFFFARSYAEEYCIRVFGKRANDVSVYKMATHYNTPENKISLPTHASESQPTESSSMPESASEELPQSTKNISLKDGYQFASVPSRIFVEKSDDLGRYYCPYCYQRVSSDVSSLCGNCGESLSV